MYPRLVIDLPKLKSNLDAVAKITKEDGGCSLMIVTKGLCADPEMAKLVATHPAVDYVADSRVKNIKTYADIVRENGKMTTLLRIPMHDEVAEVAKYVLENNIVLQEEPKPEEPEVDIEAMVLAKRERLLKETDYLVLPDYPISEERLAEIKVYRQALRDITLQEGYFENVIWPTKPNWLK